MYIVREIFSLHHYKDAKKLLDDAYSKGLLPEANSSRVLTDFTGDSYRLIFEEGYDTLSEYEISLTASLQKPEWKKWYERFKLHVEGSQREILKQVM